MAGGLGEARRRALRAPRLFERSPSESCISGGDPFLHMLQNFAAPGGFPLCDCDEYFHCANRCTRYMDFRGKTVSFLRTFCTIACMGRIFIRRQRRRRNPAKAGFNSDRTAKFPHET